MKDFDDRQRFETLCMPHLHAAYNLARWLTRNETDAEDVVQEAYLRAFRFFQGFHGSNGRVWLMAIVRNTAYSWLQHNRPAEVVHAFDETATHLSPSDNGARTEEQNPEQRFAQNVCRELVNQAIETLPLDYREVIILRELEELSYKDIADIVGIPIGTVMSRLARARKILQQRLQHRLVKDIGNGL